MDWLERMNKAMDYIEDNLSENIEFDKAAKIACCSTYHFQRMFSFITDVSLSEYIRRRRLTLAAFELQNKESKVIDIAMKFNYESPEAFSRAFKKMHGITPISARNKGVTLKAYPRMSFQISIKGDVEMDYRIERKEAFEMFGVVGIISSNNQESAFSEVPKYRIQCDENGSVDRMNDMLGRSHDAMLHAALFDHTEDSFKYMICYYVKNNMVIPKGFEKLSVPALTWAVFPAGNCDNIPDVWRRIYSEWFPTSDFEQVEGPEFEMYYGKATNATGEVWIPVKKV